MSFLRVYLYVCWPLTSDALNRKMMYAIEIAFLWKLSVLAFSKKISIDVSWFIESISPLLWKSSESGLQTKPLAMLQLHQIAFRGCRTTPRRSTKRLLRWGPARRSTAPTTSPSSTARTSAEGPKTTKTCLSITGYHRPKNNAWYWLRSNLLPAPIADQIHNSPRITTFRYPAQIVKVDTSGKRFDRQSAARKSLLHVQSGLHAIEDANDSSNTDSVKRRSRSRKPRGTRRNTIAGTDQKEIEGITENGFVSLIRFVCFIDFVEHGVSFAITLERQGKKSLEQFSRVYICAVACEWDFCWWDFNCPVFITHSFFITIHCLSLVTKIPSRGKQYATAKLIPRTPVLRSTVFILFD